MLYERFDFRDQLSGHCRVIGPDEQPRADVGLQRNASRKVE